jgi:GT2 family glycosyltransferase
MDCAEDLAAIDGRVVLFNDSPGHTPLADALAGVLPDAAALFPCRIETNGVNLGFVRTMNQAVAQAVAAGHDLLLLNSDTKVHRGALPEMVRVLRQDSTIGFVNPRSNNATIASLPVAERLQGMDAAAHRASYDALAAMLPDVSYVPTAVGFCMLIRWQILAEFGGFDEIYGKGYNEENDLVMRAARCGYRAVLANKAFVWHDGETSFGAADVTRETWEAANRAILDARYPEYATYTAAYYHAPEAIAERLLAALVPDHEGKCDLALDYSSFREEHNGTFQAGRQLLEAATAAWGDRFRTYVICNQGVYDFHGYAAFGVPRCDPHTPRQFAAIFRVGQPYDWDVLRRDFLAGATLGVYMLDTISIDCPQLFSQRLYNMWQFTLDHVDVVAAQSRQTLDLLGRRFRLPEQAIRLMSMHSLDLGEYRLPVTGSARHKAEDLLVVGNHFHHKYLPETANALALAFPERRVIALGLAKPKPGQKREAKAVADLIDADNLVGQKIGALNDREIGDYYARSAAIIFPSHAEGFGFPLLNALAARRPVLVRPLPVFLELWERFGNTPNMHFYRTTAELIEKLRTPLLWVDDGAAPADAGADRSAAEIGAAMERAISQITYERIVGRVRAMQFADDISNPAGNLTPGQSVRVEAARLVGVKTEAVFRAAFRVTPVYLAFRTLFRATRATGQLLRGRWPGATDEP